MQVTKGLILNGASTFYLGGYGAFDFMAKAVLEELKRENVHIESVLILPYLNKSMDESGYSYTIYPPLEAVPKCFVISKRNEWIIGRFDVVVAYVTHTLA